MNFGVTTADIQDSIHDLTLSARTSPSVEAVERFIARGAANVRNTLRAKQVPVPDENSTGAAADTYEQVRQIVIDYACAKTLTALGRGNEDLADSFRKAYHADMRLLKEQPRFVGNPPPGSVNAIRLAKQRYPNAPTGLPGRLARSKKGL